MNERMIVEVEMKARDALSQFEKLDAQFIETAGNNKQLYQQLWREHKKYVADVERENKKRIEMQRDKIKQYQSLASRLDVSHILQREKTILRRLESKLAEIA